jgi:hypothetical protein
MTLPLTAAQGSYLSLLRTVRLTLLAIVLSALAWHARASFAAEAFFHKPARQATSPMFFSMYSVFAQEYGAGMAKIAAGHFTAAGPYYNADGKPTGNGAAYYARVREAVTHGLSYVAHVAKHPAVVDNVTDEIRPASMSAIPEQDVRSHVRAVVDYTLRDADANAAVTAWYILPEELRPWKTGEMDYLRIVADELHRYDPLRRPVTMYNPNHRSAAELSTVVATGLDWTLMGVYAADVPFAARGARVAEGIDRILTAAAATSTKPVVAFQLSQDFPAAELQTLQAALGGVSQADAIRQVIRHDVYQGLVRGAEGVQVWSGCDCRPNLSTFADQLAAYATVSSDLNGTPNLSSVLLGGQRRDDFHATVLSGPQTVTFEMTTIPTLAWTDRVTADGRYLLLVNSAASAVTAEVTGLPAGAASITSLFDAGHVPALDPLTGRMTLALKPLEVVALRIDGVVNADADGDGHVGGDDFLIWQRNVGRIDSGESDAGEPHGPAKGDFNYDGIVDGDDLAAWRGKLASSAASTIGVPEPAGSFPLVCGALQLVARRRWRGCLDGLCTKSRVKPLDRQPALDGCR